MIYWYPTRHVSSISTDTLTSVDIMYVCTYVGNVSDGNHNLHENPCKLRQKNHLNSRKNHTCRYLITLAEYPCVAMDNINNTYV